MEPSVDDFPCASHGDFVPLGLSTYIAGGTQWFDYKVPSLEKPVPAAKISTSPLSRPFTQSPKAGIKQDM